VSPGALDCVGVLFPGDMGHAVGGLLRRRGRRVVTLLEGRSALTRQRAERAGLEPLASLDAVLEAADVVLSILPPAAAAALAERSAERMAATGRRTLYVDCNAVSPGTARRIAGRIEAAAGGFADASLIGAPPGRGPKPTRLYASGAAAERLAALAGSDAEGGLEVRVVGGEVGAASGLKMAYAGLTKGSFTLQAAVLMRAERLGLYEALTTELAESQNEAWARMQLLRFLPADAERWIGEMQEIAASFRESGLPDGFHASAETIFAAMAATPFARETRESLDPSRTLEDAIRAFCEALYSTSDQ
jgi:3-hydroxyisobutyrate dehydrogenase-like beta-hydroxyacid dehydrogenase